jgi:hypothetical protein
VKPNRNYPDDKREFAQRLRITTWSHIIS